MVLIYRGFEGNRVFKWCRGDSDRVSVMKNGKLVGTALTGDVTKDEVLGMIILGKCPPKSVPGPGALSD